MAGKHRPGRTCVVCREKKDKRLLTRLVVMDDGLRIDVSGKMNGRGAYLCANAECWASPALGAQLARALRQELSDGDLDHLRQMTPS
ncbi:MAG: YlxR family protein [Chloroflexota bacterium]|nr:YlxR family protein [Chloroflexota bacterium]MYD11402.1 YlxR family protein [Chloroflexota bacterium]